MFQKIQLKEFGRFSDIQIKASLDKYHFLSSSKCQIDIAENEFKKKGIQNLDAA